MSQLFLSILVIIAVTWQLPLWGCGCHSRCCGWYRRGGTTGADTVLTIDNPEKQAVTFTKNHSNCLDHWENVVSDVVNCFSYSLCKLSGFCLRINELHFSVSTTVWPTPLSFYSETYCFIGTELLTHHTLANLGFWHITFYSTKWYYEPTTRDVAGWQGECCSHHRQQSPRDGKINIWIKKKKRFSTLNKS